MTSTYPRVSLGELLRLERRPVEVLPEERYQEIGIYCFGRGIFHKSPRSGLEVGDKDLYLLKEGDFILQVTFAWEGALAIVSAAEDGMYGSTRYPTFRVAEDRCIPQFLLQYFKTEEGLQQLVKICPGSAGRNRVLSIKRIPEVLVPMPSIAEQQRIVARIEKLGAKLQEACKLRQQTAEEMDLLLSRATEAQLNETGWKIQPLGELLLEPPRNGLSPQPEVDDGSRRMLRINAVSSAPSRFVDLSAFKPVVVSDEQAAPFLLKNDDVFIVRYNGDMNRVAKAAIYKGRNEDGAVYPDKLLRLRPDPQQMVPDFLVYALSSRKVREQVEELGKTTAGNIGISGKNAKSFRVPVPPLPEQHRIFSELDVLQERVDSVKKLQRETSTELNALMPSVLDRAFNGEL